MSKEKIEPVTKIKAPDCFTDSEIIIIDYFSRLVSLFRGTFEMGHILYMLVKYQLPWNREVVISAGVKTRICEQINIRDKKGNISVPKLMKRIEGLEATGLIRKTGTGTYEIADGLAIRGGWVDIDNINMDVAYNQNGRFIQTCVITKGNETIKLYPKKLS